MRPLDPEILEVAVDALCFLLAPGGAPSSGTSVVKAKAVAAGGGAVKRRGHRASVPPISSLSFVPPVAARPRRHHLVLRLCGKVLASLAPRASVAAATVAPPWPATDAVVHPAAAVSTKSDVPETQGGSAGVVADAVVGSRPSATAAIGVSAAASRIQENGAVSAGVLSRPSLSDQGPPGPVTATRMGKKDDADGAKDHGRVSNDAKDSEINCRRETVLRRIGDAHAAAAEAVLNGMGDAEGASIVAFEEEVRKGKGEEGSGGRGDECSLRVVVLLVRADVGERAGLIVVIF